MRTIEIVGSFSAKLNTGNYEQEAPFFSAKEIIEGEMSDAEIQKRQKELTEICYRNFQEVEKWSKVKALEKQMKSIRWYSVNGNGLKYPSVTSIIDTINPPKRTVSENQLRACGARGSVMHLLLENYIKTGKVADPKSIPEAHKYLNILKDHNNSNSVKLGLNNDTPVHMEGDLTAFLEKFPIKFKNTEKEVFNHEYKYAGRYDADGIMDGVLTIFDLKTGSVDATKCFKQMSAYAKACDFEVGRMCVIPINGKTKQGYSKPLISDKVDEYFAMFKQDRDEFEKLFGV